MTKITWLLCLGLFSLNTFSKGPTTVLLGDLHAHSNVTDGLLPLLKTFSTAKANGLDFLAVVEHDYYFRFKKEQDLHRKDKQYQRKTIKGLLGQKRLDHFVKDFENLEKSMKDFIPLIGIEYFPTKQFGSLGFVNFIPESPPMENPELFYQSLAKHNQKNTSIGVIHHLGHLDGVFGSKKTNHFPFLELAKDEIHLMELQCAAYGIDPFIIDQKKRDLYLAFHESLTDTWLKLLSLGHKLGPVYSQCEHGALMGNRVAGKTGVIVHNSSKKALLSALKNRQVFASEDANLKASIVLGDQHLPGALIKNYGVKGKLKWQLSLVDPDEPKANYEFQLFFDPKELKDLKKPTKTFHFTGNQQSMQFETIGSFNDYLVVRLVQKAKDPLNNSNKNHLIFSPFWRK